MVDFYLRFSRYGLRQANPSTELTSQKTLSEWNIRNWLWEAISKIVRMENFPAFILYIYFFFFFFIFFYSFFFYGRCTRRVTTFLQAVETVELHYNRFLLVYKDLEKEAVKA